MTLHWKKQDAKTWITEEHIGGTPDFIITRHLVEGLARYRMKMRTSRMPLWFEDLDDAKRYAEAI